jgi:hypothetical protein
MYPFECRLYSLNEEDVFDSTNNENIYVIAHHKNNYK